MIRAAQQSELHLSKTMESPIGRLTMVVGGRGLRAILWQNERLGRVPVQIDEEEADHPLLAETERQLREYFAGARTRFELPLAPSGTPFQERVWRALDTIPFGETRSYRQIAEQIGQPKAVRAVGAANGKNPISIITPCHRVIGTSGQLVGFAGGLDVKARLLDHERARRA